MYVKKKLTASCERKTATLPTHNHLHLLSSKLFSLKRKADEVWMHLQ